MQSPFSAQPILTPRLKRRLNPLLALLSVMASTAQETPPSIAYPSPSLPAIKLGNALPENLVPANTGGEIPAIAYRTVDTFAGSGSSGSTDATGTAARFNGPWGVSRDALGNLYVADFSGKRIRKVTPEGAVSFIDSFSSFEPIATAIDPATGNLYCAIGTHRILRYVNKNAANYPAQAPVYGPETDFPDSTIVWAGSGSSGTTDATGTSARFNSPHALAVHDGHLYLADKGNNRIRRINLGTAAVETVTFTGGTLNTPEGIAVAPDGAIYVSNTGGSDLIQKIQDGEITTYAGSGVGYANGLAAFAKFDNPRGLAIDVEGNLFVAEGNNNAIRRISPDGLVTPIAGSTAGGYDATRGFQDGIGDAARFDSPRGLVFGADGLLYLTDHSNHRVRRLCLTGYEIAPALPAGLALDAATGVISGTATELTPEGGELFPHYSNTFQNGAGTATLHGAARVTPLGKLQFTLNTANSSGGITVPASNRNIQEMEVSFTLETTKASGGGQGLSYNFGEGVSGGSTGYPYAENGIGEGLSLVFDPSGESGNGVKGVRLLYGTKTYQPGSTPGQYGVLAYSPSVDWAGKSSSVTLSIDQRSRATVSIDGEALFSNIPLPADYAMTDKSEWTHAILARTDSVTDEFIIDDLTIRQSLEGAARYRVTARNAAGSGTAIASINIKEAPAIAFDFNLRIDEDEPIGMFASVGSVWDAHPTLDQQGGAVSLYIDSPVNPSESHIPVLTSDVNCRTTVGIGTLPDSRAIEGRFKKRALYRHSSGDAAWQRLTSAGDEPWVTVASNADGRVLVAGTQLRTQPGSTTQDLPGIVRHSIDSGTTWNTYTLPVNFWVKSVAINDDGSKIYVAVSGADTGFLLLSRDRGASWLTANPSGAFNIVYHVSCDATGEAVQVLSPYDPYRSTNGGGSWSAVNDSSLPTPPVYYGMSRDASLRFTKLIGFAGRVFVESAPDWRELVWVNTNVVVGSMFAASHDAGWFHVVDATGYFNTSRDRGQTWTRKRFGVDALLPGIGYTDQSKFRTLLTNYRGNRVAMVYDGKVYTSSGSGIELTHGKGESQVISTTLAAPGGFLRVTPLEGVTVTGNGTGSLVLTGPLSLVNATLESLTFQGGADFTGGASFTVTASASGVSNTETSELTIEEAAQPEMAAQSTSSSITETSAILGGSVLGNGGSALTRRGVVISPTETNSSPVRGGNDVIDLTASGTVLGAFTVNATGLAPGTSYSFRAYAVNANGPEYSATGTFTTAGGAPTDLPSDTWRLQYFGTTENTGAAADLATPDGDGIANIIKYGLCITPGTNGSPALPSLERAGDSRLVLRFRRDPSRNDVNLIVEAQSDLGGAWSSIARSDAGGAVTGSAASTETSNPDGTRTVEVKDSQPISAAPTRFLRVRVER